MKKILIAVIALVFISAGVNAQTTPQKEKAKNTQENKRSFYKEKAKELELTADQEKQIDDLDKEAQERTKAIMNDNSLSPEQKEAKVKKMEKEYAKRTEKVLTPAQQKKAKNFRENQKEKHQDKKEGTPKSHDKVKKEKSKG